MKKFPVFSWVFFAIFLANLTAAQSITDLSVGVNLFEDNSIVEYNLFLESLREVTFQIPKDSKILSVFPVNNYSLNEGIFSMEIENNLSLEYLTEELVERADKSYFLFDLSLPYNIENLEFTVILPEGAVLDDVKEIFPKPDITSDGRSIILGWEKKDLGIGDSFPVFFVFKERRSSLFWQVVWAASLILLIAIYHLIIKRIYSNSRLKNKMVGKQRKKKSVKEELHLLESEASAINALKKAGGELWQKQIQIQTGFSKAKVSRVVRNLESRGLIKRFPIGNTTKVKLK